MATRQYIGLRYVPKFADPLEWDNTNTYEALTIVAHEGDSYTSKKAVPAGIDIANETYWVKTGNFNQQVAYMQTEVTQAYNAANEAKEAAETAESSSDTVYTLMRTIGAVDESGGEITLTLNAATTDTPGAILSGATDNTQGYVVVNSDGTATIGHASDTAYGIVKVDGTTITATDGVISANGEEVTLPTASNTTLGGVKTGTSNSTTAFASVNSSGQAYVPAATTSALGTVRPDGTTITVTGGVISSAGGTIASDTAAGVVKVAETDSSLTTGSIAYGQLVVNPDTGLAAVQTATAAAAGAVRPNESDFSISTMGYLALKEYYMSAYASSAITLQSTQTALIYTEVASSNFNSTTTTFSPTASGYYLVSATIGVHDATEGDSIHLYLMQDDTELGEVWHRMSGTTDCVTLTKVVSLTAGSAYSITANNTSGDRGTISVGEGNASYLSVIRV